MKLRCPIRPFVEPLMVSLFSSLAPPPVPAVHVSLSFSRLSSNSRAMLGSGMVLPLRDEPVQLGCVRRREQLLPERLLAEHLRELGKNLKVHVCRAVRHEQHENDAHVLSVRRVERYGLACAHYGANGLLEAFDAAVR